jgi:sulfur-oxidizing protein SoxY
MSENIKLSRRGFIKATGAVCSAVLMAGAIPGLLKPVMAEEKDEDIKDTLKKLFGDKKIETGHVDLDVPIIAENGAVVPVTITSDLPMKADDYVKNIYIFSEGNLNPFVAKMGLTSTNAKAEIAMRIKMRKTSNVRAVVETSKGNLYQNMKEVKVTVGGCGG